jgi:O-antigen/teichoic acid export membrane protein
LIARTSISEALGMKTKSHIFQTGHLMHDLKGNSVRGGFYSMAATVTTQILHVGAILILARLLLPEHFGLVSMATALTVFADRVKNLGLSTATIQQKDITHEQISTLFWVNACAGLLTALLIVGLSQAIASFYQESALIPVTMALSLCFVFGGLNVQHEALLRRQMQFRALACVQVLASLLSIGLAIVLALDGFTYWALVWKEITKPAVEMFGLWIAARWWPGRPVASSEIKSLLRVGRDVFSAETIILLCRSVDQLLLGKFAGAYALGLYKAAGQLTSHATNTLTYPVASVALPTLSALQDQPVRYQRYYTKVLSLLSFVIIPLLTYMAIFSEDIVSIILGEKWLEATSIFRILVIAALIEPLYTTCGMVMITQRRSKRFLWWTIMQGAVLLPALFIGVHWGAIGIAIGYTVAHCALMIPSLWISFRNTPLSIPLFFRTISVPAFFSIIMAAILVLLAHGTRSMGNPSRIGLSTAVAVASYFGLWMIIQRNREQLFTDFSNVFSGFFKAAPGISRKKTV